MDFTRRDFLTRAILGGAAASVPLPWWMRLFQPKGRSMIVVPQNYGEIVPAGVIGLTSREDLLDVITLLSPVDSPLFTMFRKTKISNVQVEWITDELEEVMHVKGTNIARFLPRYKSA